jgi:eukaryotic-like serine/threonine-protein kinase
MKHSRLVHSLKLMIPGLLVACSASTGAIRQADQLPPCTTIGQTWTSPIDRATLVCVPAGEFLMGATADDPLARADEKPQHHVYLDAYWLDRTEVTNANFAKCMAAGACRPKVYDTETKAYVSYAVDPRYQDYPAFLYEDDVAAAYCRWAGRRLPSEAEWEKAARGTDERLFPWGNEIDCAHATYADCTLSANLAQPNLNGPRCGYSYFCNTTSVSAHPTGASPYGALNMAGNVWEWVVDWYAPDYYAHSPTRNPTGPTSGEYRVRRGGGNKSWEQDVRVTARAGESVTHFFDSQLGFRCALNATP